MDVQGILEKVSVKMEADKVEAAKVAETKEEPVTEATPVKEAEVKEEPKKEELSAEELLKKREAEMTKWAQKLIAEKKQEQESRTKAEREAQLYKDIVKEGKQIASDESKLVDLYYSKPEVAKGILDEYYGGMSFDEFVQTKELNDNTPAKIEAMATEKANEMFRKQRIGAELDSFKKEMWYDEETSKKFDEKYEFVVGGRDMTLDDINKFLLSAHQLATLDWVDYKEVKKQEEVAKRMAVSEWSAAGKDVKAIDPKVTQILNNRKNS